MTVYIYGAGGHGRDLASVVQACGRIPTLCDDNPERGPLLPAGVPYLIGVADPGLRQMMDKGLLGAPFRHPSAVIDGGVATGAGSIVAAGAVVISSLIGRHTHIGAGCTLTRTTIGDYCHISPGVDIAGDVTIGDRVSIGVGAKIANLVTIGDDATIGAGAVVVRDVAEGWTVVGVPARPVRKRAAAAI